ncbi:hypothetical protein ACP4OV_026490 [Aristida adscensionis]
MSAAAAAAVRRAGALVAAASALGLLLVLFPPAAHGRSERVTLTTTLAMFATLLLGCAAVLLSPAHRAVAKASREIQRAAEPRWAGFTCIVFCTLHAAGDMPPAAAAGVSVLGVNGGLILFLVFLIGVWTVTLSVRTGRAPRPPAAAVEEEQL